MLCHDSVRRSQEGRTFMGLFDKFAHYLAYLATDQETFRDLRGSYDGLVVPGTIAAWHLQGTGGFVLSLSAIEGPPSYVIDPRFPLFQQALPDPKQSHRALAEILGDPGLVSNETPIPGDFDSERMRRVARGWVEFNNNYGSTANEKFDKYAIRLGEVGATVGSSQSPERILAPYFVARGVSDPWWTLSKVLYDETASAAGGMPCTRVVAAQNAFVIDELLNDVGQEPAVVWVSNFDEPNRTEPELRLYRKAAEGARARSQHLFALYGGYFSVTLSGAGLDGSAHGVGFSEHRDWVELPKSGAPPARYYVLSWHRYVTRDLAQELWQADRELFSCDCEHCDGRPPNALTYHELMKHSVLARQAEIANFTSMADASAEMLQQYEAAERRIPALGLLPRIEQRAHEAVAHLPTWAAALT
jgi:hypothetical protein